MVDRPFADRRPVGPIFDIDLDRALGDKVQLGVSGTTMPDIRKSPLNVLYVLDTHVATLPRDVRGGLGDKIKDKFRDNPVVSFKRSGSSSKAPFDEQAVIVELGGLGDESLPVQQSEINRAANTIERHYSDVGVGVITIIMDTE